MRRHPLRRRPLAGLVLVALLLGGCVSAASVPTAVPSAAGVTITTAPGETLAFAPTETAVQASGPIALTFRNGSSLPHNLTFTAGLGGASRTIVQPGTTDLLVLTPTASGAYRFVCTIHEGMAGTLIVQVGGSSTERTVSMAAEDR